MKTNAVTSCCLIRRQVVDEVGYYDETLGPPFTIYEDIEYGTRVIRRGYEIHLLGHHSVLHYTCEDKEYWNPKTLHLSLAYSIIALTWRVIRATTLPLNLLRCRNTKT